MPIILDNSNQHIQRTDLIKLFIECRKINISPEKATQQVLDYINRNYSLKS